MPIPLLDLKAQYRTIESEIREAIDRVIASQSFILGEEVSCFEKSVADYCGVKHAIGVSSGTDALIVSLMALGIGPGDEVITSPYTFFGTAGSIFRLGARPVFADVEYDSFNIDPNRIQDVITDRTKAIIPVHLFGRLANMEAICRIASELGIAVVEDAAQSIGANHDGKKAGQFGDLGCFSFFPAKNLGCFGDGGMVVTDDDELADKCRILRVHGSRPKYYHKIVGGNFRLDALQAAILDVKLKHLDNWNASRRRNAAKYNELLESVDVKVPLYGDGDVFNQYSIKSDRRDELQNHLSSEKISTAIYYPLSLHEQECFSDLGYKTGDFPVSERCAKESLALPVYPELNAEDIKCVIHCIKKSHLKSE